MWIGLTDWHFSLFCQLLILQHNAVTHSLMTTYNHPAFRLLTPLHFGIWKNNSNNRIHGMILQKYAEYHEFWPRVCENISNGTESCQFYLPTLHVYSSVFLYWERTHWCSVIIQKPVWRLWALAVADLLTYTRPYSDITA